MSHLFLHIFPIREDEPMCYLTYLSFRCEEPIYISFKTTPTEEVSFHIPQRYEDNSTAKL
jgi:hypothetical protein